MPEPRRLSTVTAEQMGEVDRILDPLVDDIDRVLREEGLGGEAVHVRVTWCPNGCARPYSTEVGVVGRDHYSVFLGGRADGDRLGVRYADRVARGELAELLRRRAGSTLPPIGGLGLRAEPAALLATADLVAYDRLAPHAALDLAPAHATLVQVGKVPGRHAWSQREIQRLLVDEARQGRAVVRLKGGDPFVFGRGGEELLAYAAAAVPCRVVAGVTSAIAAPAAAGIPVTHRGVASGVAFVTGHEDPTKPTTDADLDAVAQFPGTLVFLMGVRNLARITQALRRAGRPSNEPAAIVRAASRSGQTVHTSDLARIADVARRVGIGPPATLVVGDVVTIAAAAAAATRELARSEAG